MNPLIYYFIGTRILLLGGINERNLCDTDLHPCGRSGVSADKFRGAFVHSQEASRWVHFTSHSLRHGRATRDFVLGVPIADIVLRGRWRYIQFGKALLVKLSLKAASRFDAVKGFPHPGSKKVWSVGYVTAKGWPIKEEVRKVGEVVQPQGLPSSRPKTSKLVVPTMVVMCEENQ